MFLFDLQMKRGPLSFPKLGTDPVRTEGTWRRNRRETGEKGVVGVR